MGLRGQLETRDMGVDADGDPVRYQWDAYGCAQKEWTALPSIWVVPQKFSFCPFEEGQKLFYYVGNMAFLWRYWRNDIKACIVKVSPQGEKGCEGDFFMKETWRENLTK